MRTKRHPVKVTLFVGLCAAFAVFGSLQGATLLKYNFSNSNPWPAMAGYSSAAGGSITATPAWTTVGTVDTYATTGVASTTSSSGIQLLVNSSNATGAWTAGVNSGILALSTSNAITKLGLITLAFSLQSSTAHPIQVRLESYDAGNNRTGGLTTLIYPSAAGFYQRFAVDLSTMTADGAGTFNPTHPNLRISFEIGSAVGSDGWPTGSAHELRIDNIHYATPKYYVKNASPGSDTSNNGLTETTPFKTPNKALGLAAPGDIIVLMGADTSADWFTGTSVNFTKPGAPEAWVALKNYPGQQPVIHYDTWNVININGGNTLATNPCYVEMRGLTVRGYSALDVNGDRTLLPAASAATIGQANGLSNCNGISASGRSFTYKPHNIRIADCVVEYNAGGGVSGIEIDRMSVENNVIRYNCWWMIYAGSGMSFLTPQNTESGTTYRMLVQANEVYGNECMLPWYKIQAFSDGNGIILDTYTDYSYTGRTLVQNNISYFNGGSGIHAYKATSVDIIHNTAYCNSASTHLLYSQIFDSTSTDTRILNNLMVIPANPTGDSTFNERITNTTGGSTNFIQNNVLYAEGAFVANPTGANFTPNLTTNPQFLLPSVDPTVNDFRLRLASPARNNSQILGYRAGRDFAFRTRFVDSADDRGAYQGQTSDTWAPVFALAPGNYLTAQSVSLTSDTVGATIVYSVDGIDPAVNASGVPTHGSVYSAAISLSSATTLKAVAWKTGLNPSYVSTATYTFNTATLAAIPAPSFDKLSGVYPGTVKAAILTRTPGAYMRYTTDGSTPTSSSGTLAGSYPVQVPSAGTVSAIAFKPNSGRADSTVTTASYVVRGSFGSISNGSVTDAIGSGKIRFSRFLAANDLTATQIYARVGAITGNYRCAIYSENTTTLLPNALLKASNAVTNPGTGWQSFPLTSAQALTSGIYYWLAIWSDNANASIYADTTGGTLRELSSTFGSTWPTPVTTSAATNAAYNYAIFATTNYSPVVSAGASQTISNGGSATLNGTATFSGLTLPTGTLATTWSQVSGPGTVTFANASALATTATFSAIGTYVLRLSGQDTYFTMYAPATSTVTVTVQSPSPAAAPVFSPPPGTYANAQTVTLSSTTPGATIYYTTNNTAPTTSSASVSSGSTVAIDATATLRAFAASSLYLNSTESSGTYTIQAAQPPSGVAIFGSATPTGTATMAVPSNPANLLLNPGFENGSDPSPWAILGNGASGGSVNTTTPHTGSYGAHLNTPSAGFSQYVNLKLGASYTLTGWGLKSVTSTNTYVSVNGASSPLSANYTANGGVWQQVSIPFTTNAGTGTASVQVIPWLSNGSAGNVTLDDFALYETIPAGTAYEVGTRFTCNRYGQITSLRVWHPVGGPANYTLNLWDASGALLASTSATSDGTAGWVEGVLPTPVNLAEGAGFVVSYAAPSGSNYQATPGGLATAITSGPVSTVVGNNGVYAAAAGVFPTLSSGNTNYWTDARVNPVNSPAAPGGIVRARFTDGAGSAAPQQVPGSGGDGWVGGWVSSAAVTAANAGDSPLQPTTNGYLQVVRTGGTSNQEGVYRQWSTTTRPNNQFARLTFDVRLDSSAAVFDSSADNITVAARALAGAGTSGDATFFIRAHGAATGSLQAREWGVFNGQPGQADAYDVNRLLPTGMIIQPGVTYSFIVDLYAADGAGNTGGRINGTYDVTITDGTKTAKISGAGFRSASYQSGSYLGFSSQQSSATDSLTFSVDSIEMTALVPAPLPPIAIWRAAYFNSTDLADPSLETRVWGDLADPDHDGTNNILEYALDTNPLVSATDGLPVAARNADGRLTLTFQRARAELTYIVEASNDLNAWTVLATNPGTVGDDVTVTDDPDGTSATRFLRLRIVR